MVDLVMLPEINARPLYAARGQRMIRRQIGVAETRHSIGAATARIRRAGAGNHREQRDCKNFQHDCLFFCVDPWPREHGDEYCRFNIGAKALRRQRPGAMISSAVFSAYRRRAHAVLLAILIGFAAPSGGARATPQIDEPAPSLVLSTLDGSTFDLSKLRGKVVMVNYWATWCAPCRKELPKLDAFYKKYQSQGLEIVGISIDFDRDLEKARKFARTVTYPMALAKAITDDGFGIPKGVPITWVVDTDGKVRDQFIEVRGELLSDIVVPLLPH
jgi:thiol-disulfide isomerase/thioredoxin